MLVVASLFDSATAFLHRGFGSAVLADMRTKVRRASFTAMASGNIAAIVESVGSDLRFST